MKKLNKGKDSKEWELKLFNAARKIKDQYSPIHWELDFPNIIHRQRWI